MDPIYLPCNIDNCLQNAENTVCVKICDVLCSRRNNSLPFGVINKARTHYSAGKNAKLLCVKHRDHGIVRGSGGRWGSFWVHRGEH